MSSIPRPGLAEAARLWMANPQGDPQAVERLAEALADFVDKRYRGAAADLRQVHDLRAELLSDDRPMETLTDATGIPADTRTVGEAASDSAPPDQGRLLFHLVHRFAPRSVLEMGTNIGVSAAYIALGLRYGSEGVLTSIEASGVRLELARRHLARLGIENVRLVEGYFDDVLPGLLTGLPGPDVAFVDGNHQLEATVAYFGLLRSHMLTGGLLVFDDIRWSPGMLEAWNCIRAEPDLGAVVDLGRTGLVVIS